jgi:hypothetical protein
MASVIAVLIGVQMYVFHERLARGLESHSRATPPVGTTPQQQSTDRDDLKALLVMIDSPPWYLRPGAILTRAATELRNVVQFNQGLYMARTGQESEARRVLGDVRASAKNPQLAARANYLLGRLNYEHYRKKPEVQHYNEAVRYVRESLQSDPELTVAKRFLDFLLSFDESPATARPGSGRVRLQTQGDEGVIGERTPRF